MGKDTGEKYAEYLLKETKEGEENTQLENMTGLARKIITYLDDFIRPHQDSPDASTLMKYLKEKTSIDDERIIINNIKNILKYRNNDVTIGERGKERKNLVNLKIYNYCSTLIKGYENMFENIESNQQNITETFESDPNQIKIEFPED